MLECGKSMKSKISEISPECNVLDNKQHTLIECRKWLDSNADNTVDVNSCDIYNEDQDERIINGFVKY